MRIVNIDSELEIAAFAEEAVHHFAENARIYIYCSGNGDPYPGDLMAVRWNAYHVLVIRLHPDADVTLHEVWPVIHDELPPLKEVWPVVERTRAGVPEDLHTFMVADDGTIQDQVEETFYARYLGILFPADTQFIRVLATLDGQDIETRIAYGTLIKAGWTPPQQ